MSGVACVTVDLDPLETYLRNRGLDPRSCPRPRAVLTDALPRFLELLETRGIRATFFVVGTDALHPENAALLRDAVGRGHEIANHSHTHPYDLSALSVSEIEAEITAAQDAITAAVGRRPVGFRAPGWNVCPALFRLLESHGYRYDASLVPLPLGRLLPFALPVIKRTGPPIFRNQIAWPNPGHSPYRVDPNTPHRPGESRLREIPGGWQSFPPVPLSSTFSALLGDRISGLWERLAPLVSAPLVYIFHGLDLLDHTTGIAAPLGAAKPGLRDPLDVKVRRVNRILDALGKGRRFVRLQDLG
jgi:peptidoglycan-N-acetylglucosamine deacetylase